MLDVLEMLQAGRLDGDLFQGDTQRANQVTCVGVGTIRRSEARHRDADDALTRQLEGIESHHRYQQSQGGIQAS